MKKPVSLKDKIGWYDKLLKFMDWLEEYHPEIIDEYVKEKGEL
jgi:hypothetical protein